MTSQGGCQRDGHRLLVPADVDATVYIALIVGAEALVVDRVTWVDVGADLATVGTARKERYVVAYEQIAALRFSARGNGPGYA